MIKKFILPFALLILSASVSYATGFSIVKDPWTDLDVHSGFAQTVNQLVQVYDKVYAHYKYAMYRDTWTSPLSIQDSYSRIAALNVRPQQVGWSGGGVFSQSMPNVQADIEDMQNTIATGQNPQVLRDHVYTLYGDPTTGGVERTYRDVAASQYQVGLTNQAISENLANAQRTKQMLEGCSQCTQSDKDRLTTQLNYYLQMAAGYGAQSNNYSALIQGDQAAMEAQKTNQENQNRWHERDAARALVGITRVGVGPVSGQSSQD